MGIAALTVDAFGTVLDTGRTAVVEVAADVVRREGIAATPAVFLAAWDAVFVDLQDSRARPFRNLAAISEASLAATLKRFGSPADPRTYIDRLLERWREARPFPDAVAALERLRGVPIAIVSNADDAFLRNLLDRENLDVGVVVTSEATRSYKPDAGIFVAALAALGSQPGSTLHVGDSFGEDIVGAKAVGMPAAWLNRAHAQRPPSGPRPDFEFSDLRELPGVVGRPVG